MPLHKAMQKQSTRSPQLLPCVCCWTAGCRTREDYGLTSQDSCCFVLHVHKPCGNRYKLQRLLDTHGCWVVSRKQTTVLIQMTVSHWTFSSNSLLLSFKVTSLVSLHGLILSLMASSQSDLVKQLSNYFWTIVSRLTWI